MWDLLRRLTFPHFSGWGHCNTFQWFPAGCTSKALQTRLILGYVHVLWVAFFWTLILTPYLSTDEVNINSFSISQVMFWSWKQASLIINTVQQPFSHNEFYGFCLICNQKQPSHSNYNSIIRGSPVKQKENTWKDWEIFIAFLWNSLLEI